MYIFITILTIVMFGFYLNEMRKTKLNTRTVIYVGLFSAISYILNMMQLISYPNGGGITLFSMLPIMLLGVIFGPGIGMTSGIILGVIKMLNGGVFLHPLQVILDYILANIVLGLAGIFGYNKKYKLMLGGLLVTVLSTALCTLSGVVFFGQYAPEGMSAVTYSLIYNVSSLGVEGMLTSSLLTLIPISRLLKVANSDQSQKQKLEG